MTLPRQGKYRLGTGKTNMLLIKNIGKSETRLKMWLYQKVNQWENRVNYTPDLHLYWHKVPMSSRTRSEDKI